MAPLRKPPVIPPAERTVVAALPDPAIITRNHWEEGGAVILYANPEFCRLTGYGAEELAGKNTHLLHGPLTELKLLQTKRHDRRHSGEGWLYRKDGTVFFARWIFGPLAGPDGPAGRRVALYHDQSELKQLREALLQSRKLETVGLLAGGVAHDFNNLLSIINGYCEIVRKKIGETAEVREDLQEIHRAGLKAAEIARQILEFSRRQEAEVRVVNYNTLIREIAEIIRRIAGDTVTVELRLASDLGNARIDPTQFQQVLLNLCFNAREAMPQGGKLVVRTYNHEVVASVDRRGAGLSRGFYPAMRVSDTGQGIKPEVLKRIFEPFFTTKLHGTGLGLATVLGILHQHNGHIAVQSKPGRGTTFEVILPETSEPEQTVPLPAAGGSAARGTEELLIIEQEAVLRKMITGILTNAGYRVTATATAATVRKDGLQPRLVLADCTGRGVGALVRRLHTKNPALRLIDVSGEPAAALPPDFSARARAHLPKPFTLSTLLLSVRTLLDADIRGT